jgi:ankyrin repeat protein
MNPKTSCLVVTFACLLTVSCSSQALSPLAAAARAGDVGTIQTLLRGGADPNAPSGDNGWTPLHHAIHRNQAEAVHALIAGGADVNASCCNGLTPLMMAASYGRTEIVRGLLARGADPRRRLSTQLTALDLAVSGVPDIDAFTLGGCQTETVKALMDSAPDVRPVSNGLARISSLIRRCPELDRMLAQQRRTSAH